ncbi:LOW QUALITY PROTEIN: hypothetical protein U9M48_018105 [Paspalum notatum var. saurae]|uniref:Uncharacterized protein n=1 Tax=Paspalum notatum var. saurae TaxID=547442 RepID=A0AAQ3WPI6_PASNO
MADTPPPPALRHPSPRNSLEYKDAATGGSLLRLRHQRMYVNRLDCDRDVDGAVRAYMVFYTNQSDGLPSHYTPQWRQKESWFEEDEEVHGQNDDPLFLVGDEALVADGFWDESRSQLDLRACRVVSSGKSLAESRT